MNTAEFAERRLDMVTNQIQARGIRNKAVLQAMRHVPRELFVSEDLQDFAYEDTPLPIGDDQTISQPFIVALMTESLELSGGENVLEIGGGSGYAAAVIGQIADRVCTVERIKKLSEQASATLQSLNYHNIEVVCADGTKGFVERAPYDAIIVSASGPDIPENLKSQLKIGGRLVIPVGPQKTTQTLIRIRRKSETEYSSESIAEVRFVPLIGEHSWKSA